MFAKSYTRSEIAFIDNLLTYNYGMDLEDFNLGIKEINGLDWYHEEIATQLKAKGILNIKRIDYSESEYEGALEKVITKEAQCLTINIEELIVHWFNTVCSLAGKSLGKEAQFVKDGENSFLSIQLDNNEETKLYFITNKKLLTFNADRLYVSFVNELNPLVNMFYWDEPLAEENAAVSFFQKLKEENKRLSNKNFYYLNIPTHLEATEKEGFFAVIDNYLITLGFQSYNRSEYFRPESIDFNLAEDMIKEVYIKNETKIFLIINGNRLELHNFEGGLKQSSKFFSFHIEKMQKLLKKKVNNYKTNIQRKNLNILKDFKVVVPFIISILISAIASFKILFAGSYQQVMKSSFWLWTHISISLLSIGLLFFLGLYPLLYLFFFSWIKNVKKQAKKFVKEYEKHSEG
ncbi:hypothetical protein LAV77_25245 [Priestia megaterium]|uniref:hypothetical protein n=1 Tax=Priestia megaterium TaxID=1404 RepID=UPI002B24059A|nr:hypothetical protein [Priestia megaterium]MEB2268120.1 hypothetical protein [Priestia megaterium]